MARKKGFGRAVSAFERGTASVGNRIHEGWEVSQGADSDVVLTEDQEQFRFVTWFKNTHKGIRIFAIPNGGLRNKVVAATLKSTGVSPGVPDLYIPAWKLWIEMKRAKGGVVSDVQKDWLAYLNEIGDTAIVCRGWLEAKEAVERLFPDVMPSQIER